MPLARQDRTRPRQTVALFMHPKIAHADQHAMPWLTKRIPA
jgi:hypothetical protein